MKTIPYFFLITLLSCNKGFDCAYMRPGSAQDTQFELKVKDAVTKDYLIKLSNSTFLTTDIKVSSSDNPNVKLEFKQDGDGLFLVLENVIPKSDKLNTDYCRTLYIDYKTDRDTVDYCYRIVETDCGGTNTPGLIFKYNNKRITADYDPASDIYTVFK